MISRAMWIFRKNREHISLETLSEYLDGRLSAGKRQVVQRHLETCSECREELGSLEYTVGLLRQAPVITPRRVFTLVGAPPLQPAPHRVRVPAWAAGAAASVAVLLFALVTSADLGGLLAGDAPSPEIPDPSEVASLPTLTPQPAAVPAAPEVPTQTEADAIAAEASVDEAGSAPTPSLVAMNREAAGLEPGVTATELMPKEEGEVGMESAEAESATAASTRPPQMAAAQGPAGVTLAPPAIAAAAEPSQDQNAAKDTTAMASTPTPVTEVAPTPGIEPEAQAPTVVAMAQEVPTSVPALTAPPVSRSSRPRWCLWQIR